MIRLEAFHNKFFYHIDAFHSTWTTAGFTWTELESLLGADSVQLLDTWQVDTIGVARVVLHPSSVRIFIHQRFRYCLKFNCHIFAHNNGN